MQNLLLSWLFRLLSLLLIMLLMLLSGWFNRCSSHAFTVIAVAVFRPSPFLQDFHALSRRQSAIRYSKL